MKIAIFFSIVIIALFWQFASIADVVELMPYKDRHATSGEYDVFIGSVIREFANDKECIEEQNYCN